MKKTILSLLFIVISASCFYGQANISVQAPPLNNYLTYLPGGNASTNYGRGCFLITNAELPALLSSNITALSFLLLQGPVSPLTVSLTLYLQNTNDFLYSKGTTYTNIINGMTTVYSGPMTVQASTTSTVTLPFPTNFNYTGDGLYVAYEWTPVTPAQSNPPLVYYAASSAGNTNMGAFKINGTNNPNQLAFLNLNTYRPVCIFEAINSATNESEVVMINSPGKIAESLHGSYTILADVQNKSVNALTNLNVTLDIIGVNTFNDVQVIPSIAAGAVETVTFTAFTPNTLGNNLISVTVPNDQNNANNQKTLNQHVTCEVAANNPPAVSYSTSYGSQNNPGICLSRFNFTTPGTLKAVNLAVGVDYSSNGAISGVVLDDQGVIIATTNTINPAANVFNSFQTFTFINELQLNANTDYYIGMAQSKGYYMGANIVPSPPNTYFSSTIFGGVLYPHDEVFFGIEPVIAGQGIQIIQASTVICQGESIQLSASAGATFTWSSSVFNPIEGDINSAGIIVSPTSNEMYTLKSLDDAGCLGTTTAPVAVKPCTGISENGSLENLELYPNPSANGKAFVKGLEGLNTLTVLNILGEVVYTTQSVNKVVEIDLASQPTGTYLVKVEQADKSVKIFKLVNQL